MRWFYFFVIVLVQCECFNETFEDCANVKTDVGSLRKRRHLTFPDGSNMVLTISLVKAFMTHAPSGWNIAIEIDVMFPLPDEKFTNTAFRRKLHHQQKREFWSRLQSSIDFYNMNGRSCLLRSICEAPTHLAPPGKSLVHDILRAIFAAPVHEKDFREEMKGFDELTDPNFCDRAYDCPFSILDLMLSFNKQ